MGVCNKRFSTRHNLRDHKVVHLEGRPASCDICGKTFKSTKRLSLHKRIHSEEKPYTCDQCGKTFRTGSDLSIHLKSHSGGYKCELCPQYSFAALRGLNDHKMIHTGERPYECDVCQKKFITSSALKSHKKVHSDIKAFSCEQCEAQFRFRQGLLNHIERKHSDKRKVYKCRECGKTYLNSDSLKKHKIMHMGGCGQIQMNGVNLIKQTNL